MDITDITNKIKDTAKNIDTNKIKNTAKDISPNQRWLIVAVVIALVFFYWFGVRPGQIRKECAGKYGQASEYNYKQCLRSHGF